MRVWMILAGLMVLAANAQAARADAPADELWDRFTNPPAEARPFMRWWWNGNAVELDELLRELDVMQAAGIGGVEINPIALPPTALTPEAHTWLSDDWNEIVRQVTRACAERGMIADMIVGSGWPFGAEFLEPDEICQRVSVKRIELEGPRSVRLQNQELVQLPAQARDIKAATQIQQVILTPDPISDLSQRIDLTDTLDAEGALTVQVPPGRHVLYCVFIERGYRTVRLGAPGAAGSVVDHYNREALTRYLNQMSEKLGPVLGGRLGPALRAMFCDSIELAGANWTDDLAAEFKRRRGYDLLDYLPFIIEFEQPIEDADPWSDTLRRARYDYSRTLVELFHERFVETFHAWCNANGTLSRYQAYGLPFLMGIEDAYRIPDIPESNNWLFGPERDWHGWPMWTKYASSGGHQAGRSIISSEAHTNTQGVFRATLEVFKGADDFNFIMGINHSVLHGFNYSPPEAGFPGWVRFGAYFSEQNTWWPYFKLWADYNARLSAVFQASRPVAQVALLYPSADTWSTHGLTRVPFQTLPPHAHHLWRWIQQNGAAADYVSETLLQQATYEGGKINFGPMAYEALIVYQAQTLQPATMAALERYAAAGGRIAFVGTTPSRSPGLRDARENDREIQMAAERLLAGAGGVAQVPAPREEEDCLAWTDRLLDSLSVRRSLALERPVEDVYLLHHRHDRSDLIFLANTNQADVTLRAVFPETERGVWRWDPETGTRAPYPIGADGRLEIALRPLESLLLVFAPGTPAAPPTPLPLAPMTTVEITGPWEATFQPAHEGAPFTLDGFTLQDLAASPDPRLHSFAGTILYRTRLDWDGATGEVLRLNLGEVLNAVSEVTLNGQPLGVRWYGWHDYDITPALRPGENTLEIKLTTTLFNHVRTLLYNPGAIFARPNKAQRVAGLTMLPPEPSGLLGPVRIGRQSEN